MEENDRKSTMKKLHFNSLFFKLAVTVMAGGIVLAICLFFTNIRSSENIFAELFSSSQAKIFSQIEENFYNFYMDVTEISKSVANSEKVETFLTEEYKDTVEEQRVTFEMKKQVQEMKISEYDNMTLLLVGVNARSYMYSYADQVSSPLAEILELTVTKEAAESRGRLICKYMDKGFTDTTKNSPVIVCCRTIEMNQDIIGYVYLVIKETEMQEFYDYFISGTSDIVVFNSKNEVISTNNSSYLNTGGESLLRLQNIVEESKQSRIYHTTKEVNGETITYLVQQFTNTDFVIAGTVNAERAFYETYNLVYNIAVAFFIVLCNIAIIFILVRHQTRPLYQLANTMRSQKNRDFNGYIEVDGTDEIKELCQTYNEMISDMRHYIEKVVETEQAKRNVELHALQMQINPHYIYNTLASIKWLIMQGDAEQSTETIDAFISLLRNTISNADEFIPIRQEIVNLKNYVKINQTRYGDKVKVEFYVPEECMDCKIPKLALQPFIENAFFHAFPGDRGGNINVFMRRMENNLLIEIADDGIGMAKERKESMFHENKSDHFTGIGVKNVNERLKLIYGMDYGISIESEENAGTTITVVIPFQELVNEK